MSLTELVQIVDAFLSPATRSLHDFAPRLAEWIHENHGRMVEQAQFHHTRYLRKVLYYEESRFEIVLIGWLPDQETSIHGHPLGGCLFTTLQGQLQETRYSKEGEMVQILDAGSDVQYIDNHLGMHAVRCVSTEPAVSLHVYSPPFHSVQASARDTVPDWPSTTRCTP